MSKLRTKVMKRCFAFVLTIAMMMSNMTVLASETTPGGNSQVSVAAEEGVEQEENVAEPTAAPEESAEPTEAAEPTESAEESADPTEIPAEPTEAPAEPTEIPAEPTEAPAEPTEIPTESPSAEPSATPSEEPSVSPSAKPTTDVKINEDAPVWDASKIDVWDFGAKQLDENIYNNMLTADIINKNFYPEGTEAGTAGKNIASFVCGDIAFNDGGYPATHRLRTTNTAITRYDENALQNAADYPGYIYSNKGGTADVYVSIKANKGDIITVALADNNVAATVVFENMSDASDSASCVTTGNKTATEFEFYAKADATYKIYASKDKLFLARLYRERTAEVTVSGSVTAPEELTGYSVVFTNQKTGVETVAAVADGAYSAKLNEKYTYDVSLKDATGYIITSAQELALEKGCGDQTFDITVEAVKQYKVSGKITGLTVAAAKDLKLGLINDEKIFKPEVVITVADDDTVTYEATVENNVPYELKATDANDYVFKEGTTTTGLVFTENTTLNIEFTAKPTYAVTLDLVGATAEDLKEAKFIFTNLDEVKSDGETKYAYTFIGTEGIALRDGTYSVVVKNSGIFVQQLTSNLKVEGAPVTKTIKFRSDITEWNFNDAAFTTAYNDAVAEAGEAGLQEWQYQGLVLNNLVKAHQGKYAISSDGGQIKVPVKGDCRVTVSYCYEAVGTIGDVEFQTVSGSTGKIESTSFDYKGEAGYVLVSTIQKELEKTDGTKKTVKASYLSSIKVTVEKPYQETITVGAESCDYTTINDALDAVEAMKREAGQVVTIAIQPGNYEEMLVIDVDDIVLKNASNTPSTALTNKGVDIDANAVRITSYYGHGYAYYSMGSDCKWDAETLEVNKQNGYPSFTNPGSGTTSGSYWNATVVIGGNNVSAEGIIFENSFNQYVSEKAANDVIVPLSGAKEPKGAPRAKLSAGSIAVQNKDYVERAAALAIKDNAKQISFDNCKFIGRQDTLYGGKGATAAFYDCAVYGGTDYIFGGMTAVFAKCDLVFNTSEDKNDVGYITAPQQASGRGYLMYNCHVTSTTPGVDTASEKTSKPGYFGRPWAPNTSEAFFYKTVIDAADTSWYETSASLIQPLGWLTTLGGASALCGEYGTFEYAKDTDYDDFRADWAGVRYVEKLMDDTPVSVEAFLGDWDAFAGKDMTIVMPSADEKVDNKPVEEPETGNYGTFTLESKNLPAMGAGAKADGDTTAAGTNDFFTIIWSAKSKVDSSSKTWDDGYASGQRLNLGGKAETGKNAVKFTTDAAATVNIWWAESGDDGRQITILDSAGNAAATTSVASPVKNAAYFSTLELSAAGTYYLGGDINNNYIFKVEVIVTQPPKVSSLESKDLPAMAAGTKADGDTTAAGTDDFFTIIWSAKSKVDSSSKTWDDGYASGQRISLGGKAETGKNSIKFTTERAAKVDVWWAESGDDGRQITILDSAGNAAATTSVASPVKNAAYISTLELSAAGTYYLGGDINNNYIFKIVVTEGEVKEVVRGDWAEVAAPTITATLSEDGKEINVTAVGHVGVDGADRIEVTMYDAEGKAVGDPQKSAAKKEEAEDPESAEAITHTFTFKPSASGTYTFDAKLVRTGEEDKVSDKTEAVTYKLPLEKPALSSVSNLGDCKIALEWTAVKEATSYIITVQEADKEETKKEFEASTTSYTIAEGLEAGKKYTIAVKAKRVVGEGETAVIDYGEAVETTITAREKADIKWNFAAYGSSTDTKNNGFEGNANEGSVTVYSENGKGKLVPASTDGLAFYYTEVPVDRNFKLTAKVHVDSWTLSNAQEGFGLMASDRVGKNGDSKTFWNNSYMAAATKVEYFWDSELSQVSNAGDKITMKMGLGSLERIGVTAENLADFNANKTATINSEFKSNMYPLSTSAAQLGAGTYNMIGNYSGNTPTGTLDKVITDMILTIERNNTGYFVTYTNEYGKEFTKKYYDRDALCKIDTDTIYVGMFASRNARVTFTDVDLVTSDPATDADAESQPVSYLAPSYSFTSASVANKSDYTLEFTSNWEGTLTIKDSVGREILPAKEIKAEADGKIKPVKIPVTLSIGKNAFKATFTPNKEYDPNGDGLTQLSDYTAKEISHTVSYAKYGQAGDYLYVSPKGSANGTGEKVNPLDIYTAVKYVQPGQTILLMEGTYYLSKTIKVERGVDGTEEAPVKMIADPAAGSRPVFNFGGNCAGMVLAGNYWYFRGFDVTRSADAQKGIQVSGNHNILDQINTYKNGNTGIQISRLSAADATIESWPSYNTILNCTSYENADKGYEDADGFAAKLTVGPGNVFDGCVAHHNADDGWDLFAKVETGPIGTVVIRNSIAYKNGYVLDASGNEVNAGNGNGFKLGGEGITGKHELHNSLAFDNKAKGIDSNSCPDIRVYNSVAFNNGSYNVAFYSKNTNDTAFYAENVVSFRTEALDMKEQIDLLGSQVKTDVYNSSNYFWDEASGKSVNTDGVSFKKRWFKSIAFSGFTRNADGTLDLNGFLELAENSAFEGTEIGMGEGQSSEPEVKPEDIKETSGDVDKGDISGGNTGVDPGDLGDDIVVKNGLWVGNIEAQYYTGKAIRPTVNVYESETLLSKKDYSVTYKNNVNASVDSDGDGEVEPAVITVKGKGNYSGTDTASFLILPVSLEEGFTIPATVKTVFGEEVIDKEVISVDNIAVTYNKKVQKPSPAVYYNGRKLVKNRDYVLDEASTKGYKEPGVYTVTITGKAPNFTGTREITFEIVDKSKKTMIKDVSVGRIANQTYDADGVEPALTLIDKKPTPDYTLVEGTDYTVKFVNNDKVGKATAIIEGIGNYAGTKKVTFNIVATKLVAKDTVFKSGDKEISKDFVVTYSGKKVEFSDLVVTANGVELTKNTDYIVSYKNNGKKGTASVVIKGINGYSGTVTKNFKINAYDLEHPGEGDQLEVLYSESVAYQKSGNKPSVKVVLNGRALTEKTDYTVSYTRNARVTKASEIGNPQKMPAITITGKNGFTGKIVKNFTITPGVFDEITCQAVAKDVVYKKSNKANYKTSIAVYDNGKKLSAGSDYCATKDIKYYLSTADGTYIEEDLLGNSPVAEPVLGEDGIYITAVITGKGNYEGAKIEATYRVVKYSISSIKVQTISKEYTGSKVTLNVVPDEETGLHDLSGKITYRVKDATGKLVTRELEYGEDYVIVPGTYKRNDRIGTAKVTIQGLGDFGGTKEISFKITRKPFAWFK